MVKYLKKYQGEEVEYKIVGLRARDMKEYHSTSLIHRMEDFFEEFGAFVSRVACPPLRHGGLSVFHLDNVTLEFRYNCKGIEGKGNIPDWIPKKHEELYKEWDRRRDELGYIDRKISARMAAITRKMEEFKGNYVNMDLDVYLVTRKDNDIEWLVDKIVKKYPFLKIRNNVVPIRQNVFDVLCE